MCFYYYIKDSYFLSHLNLKILNIKIKLLISPYNLIHIFNKPKSFSSSDWIVSDIELYSFIELTSPSNTLTVTFLNFSSWSNYICCGCKRGNTYCKITCISFIFAALLNKLISILSNTSSARFPNCPLIVAVNLFEVP